MVRGLVAVSLRSGIPFGDLVTMDPYLLGTYIDVLSTMKD